MPKGQERGDRSPGKPAGETVLQGTVERVAYHHPTSRYTVLEIAPEPGSEPPAGLFSGQERRLRAVGIAAGEVPIGGRLQLRGSWKVHPRHGPQLHFQTLEILPPLGRAGLVRYLSSKTFRGIGPKLAERIADQLGPDALQRIDREPELLKNVRGLKRAVRDSLVAALRAQRGARELQAFLFGLDLTSAQVAETARALGAQAEAQIREDPYLLSRTVRGIGFQSADRAARKLGLAEDSPQRRAAALAFALELAASDGHTLLGREPLQSRAQELLGRSLEARVIDEDLETLERTGELVLERSLRPGQVLVYLPGLARCEAELAKNLAGLLRSGPVRGLYDERRVRAAEARAGLALHPDQRAAVEGCLAHPVALLTGGPGVGKTTIVGLVVELAEQAGLTVVLASPTGRAAKRLSEATGRPAGTIHRLLGWDPARRRFEHDQHEPLAAEFVVVDEISMLDVVLAHHLLKAIQPPTRLVLVGDPDQLPSVSAGNVLADLIASERVPVFRLSRVFRQESEGLIVENAHRILRGELPRVLGRNDPPGDFYFFPAEDDEQAAARLLEVVTQRIPRRFELEWEHDVQVLAPMYRGACGVDNLNEKLRSALGLGGPEIRWRERTWREGDRVIQTRNDYDKQVFNGDMGRVVRVNPQGPSLTVRFPERELVYAAEELADLSCAFAITVHRSQGGEFPAVVMPLVTQHWPMLQRNLLYTAVTRAMRLVVLIGSQRALARAVANARPSERESALAERLRALVSAPGS